MRNSIKGASAVAAATVLLLGGAGTLSYWSDSEEVTGDIADSGTLSLTQETGQVCSAWTLDAAGGATTYTTTTEIVPGDVLSRTCTYTVNASGAHLKADLTMETPTVTDTTGTGLAAQLDVAAGYTLGVTTVSTGHDITSADDGKVLTADITVTFDSTTSGLTAQGVSATLDAITIGLTQTHA